jgi:hypothetical protein
VRPWKQPRAVCPSSRSTSAGAARWSTTGTPGCWYAVALADAIATVAADPIRRQAMGRAARAHAEAEFDDRRVIDRTFDTYRQLLSGLSATRHRGGLPAGDQPGLTPR